MRKGLSPALALLLVLVLAPTAAAQRRSATTCDPFASRSCLMPFPNDMNLTVRDRKSPTGLRVRLPARAMPANKSGRRIAVSEFNRQDGFSPGQSIVVRVPGLTSDRAFRRSRLVPLSDLGQASKDRTWPVVINARTRERHLVYAELDANAKRASERMLLLHPGENFEEGERYIVALGGLRTASGKRIKASKGFRALKRGAGPQRLRARYRGIFRTLRRAGVAQGQAHDGVGLHRRLRARPDRAHAAHPQRRVRPARRPQPRRRPRRGQRAAVHGHQRGRQPRPADPAPHLRHLHRAVLPQRARAARPARRFNYASRAKDALPAQRPGNTQTAKFECEIPVAAATRPAKAALYGHGLLGGPEEVDAGNIRDMAQEHGFAFCATAWSGFSSEDVPTAVKILGDLSSFPKFPDRIQQGFVNQLYLGRLFIHPQGLSSHPAFAGLVDPSRLYYDGNSQGGILGTALTAMAPDFQRAVLGVPGINFSVLLTRSSHWATYGAVFNPAYTRESERPLALVAHQHAVGPRGGQRLGAPRHRRPARRHPVAPRPAARRGRRLAGHDLPGRRARADDRRARPQARRSCPAARSSACRCSTSPRSAARSRARRSCTGTAGRRAAPTATGRPCWRTRRRVRAGIRTARRARPWRHGARRPSS